jgi:SAM-dependent methyltransferase
MTGEPDADLEFLEVRTKDCAEKRVLRDAARRFLRAGIGPWIFASVKLRIDPVYVEVLRQGLLRSGRILDLGCGQGITLAAIRAAQEAYRSGSFPSSWRPPPENVELRGIDVRRRQVRVAREALSEEARIDAADLRSAELPSSRAVLIFDALHYLGREEQDALLHKVRDAVGSGGILLLREADADGGRGFDAVRWSERVRSTLRGAAGQTFHYRSAASWVESIRSLGFETRVQDMGGRTPFRNVLVHGVRRSS